MLLCIPFWYDDTGYSDELELLVKNSDGICVMNYWRRKEWEHMEYELAGKYYKKLWSAYEFTKSDGKGMIVCVRIFFIRFHNYQKWNVFWC